MVHPTPTRPAGREPRRPRLILYALSLGLVWTAALATSLVLNLQESKRSVLSLARVQAEAAVRRDVAHRDWVAEKGGVYVQSSEATPPNPYLAHVPERDVFTESGRQLTLVNSAYMTRQVEEMLRRPRAERLHVTSLRLLRPENAPDAWEAAALARLERGEPRVESLAAIDGQPHLRLMWPLAVEERCMKCHASQGYRVGEVRGGVGLAVPLAPLLEIRRPHDRALALGHAAIWLLGIGGLGFAAHRLATRMRERDLAEAALREAEAERARLEEQLAHSQKLEAIGQLAGGVAHDFNNLLTVILSSADALKHESASGAPPDPEVVSEIRAAGERARDLTRQLLAYVRRQASAPVAVDLNAIVRSSEKLLRRVLTEDVVLVTKLQPGLWPIRCDPGRIEQVLLNLGVNAHDAMPSGGALTVETSNQEVGTEQAALYPGIAPGPHVRLAMHDTGTGMAAEVREHAFEPFFTTKAEGKGTGLGLATVHAIVRQSGGFIRLESEPGYGTTFEILFPRIAEEVSEEVEPAGATRSAGGTETVLLVEDDPHVRRVTARALGAAGYTLLLASNGLEAVEALASHPGRVDLLITDVVMPGVDGRQLADAVRKEWPTARVLFVSGHAPDILDQRGVLERGVDLLPKPYTPASLLARVRAALGHAP